MDVQTTPNVEVKKVVTKREQKQFLSFVLNLYKGNAYFVPPIYGDEKKIFKKSYFYYETARAEYFLAFRGKTVVGRVSVLVQDLANKKYGEKRARFTRFDCIDDKEVACALLTAAENWARDQGMDTICGPMGFSDLEREGLLISGFEEHQTFEEQYNYPYYQALIESCGYIKDVDWFELRLTKPKDEYYEKLRQLSEATLKKFKLHIGSAKTNRGYIKKYLTGVFDLLDKGYSGLYGTFPLTEKMRISIANSFKLIINKKYCMVICDENEKLVGFSLGIPGIGRDLQKSGGRLTPLCVLKLLRTKYYPKTIDLGLIALVPEMLNSGVNSVMIYELARIMKTTNIEYFESNLTLESNEKVRSQFKYFNYVIHKVRRSFVKPLL